MIAWQPQEDERDEAAKARAVALGGETVQAGVKVTLVPRNSPNGDRFKGLQVDEHDLFSGRVAGHDTEDVPVRCPLDSGRDIRGNHRTIVAGYDSVRAQISETCRGNAMADLLRLQQVGVLGQNGVPIDARQTTILGKSATNGSGNRRRSWVSAGRRIAARVQSFGVERRNSWMGTSTWRFWLSNSNLFKRGTASVLAVVCMVTIAGCQSDPDAIPDMDYAQVEAFQC